MFQQFHREGNHWPDLLLEFRYIPASVYHEELRADKRMYTLCPENREALKRNTTNLLVGTPQPFHDDGNHGPDVLLEFRYTPASVGHKVSPKENAYLVLRDQQCT
jgi:hypothetical protein